MYFRQADIDGYLRVARFERALRKVLRWELRGERGCAWYAELGEFSARIEERIEAEKKQGFYQSGTSPLSYLSLSELLDLIFRDLWSSTFQRIVLDKHLRRDLRDVVSVRNKIAHFRAVAKREAEDIEAARRLLGRLISHYRRADLLIAHLSGAPERAGEQIEPGLQRPLMAALEGNSLGNVWEQYESIEGVRAAGIFPGIGIFDRHLFIEFYTRSSYRSGSLLKWLEARESEVTFCVVGKTASFIRAFVPICVGARIATKCVRGLASVARESVSEDAGSERQAISDFDFGSREGLVGDAVDSDFSFAF